MNLLAKNLLILASAGSGKTYQLTNRIAGLVARGQAPERMIALTFTRKAAGEFADALLTKLACAADDPVEAVRFRADIQVPDADVEVMLEQVVRALPRFSLGTMDGFFAKLLRLFPHELGLAGDHFQLLEGPAAAAMQDAVLAELLGQLPSEELEDAFMHGYRRAVAGRPSVGVVDSLRKFTTTWRGWLWRLPHAEWGPSFDLAVPIEAWERQKMALAADALRHLHAQTFTRKGQDQQLEALVWAIAHHTVGSGSLSKAGSLFGGLVAAACDADAGEDDPLDLKYYKEFSVRAPMSGALRRLVRLCVGAEVQHAVERTRAIREVVTIYDAWCEVRLRRRGWLGFDDIKRLMGAWARHESAQELRHWVDFRMDARIDHWLLDEFQDTSYEDWAGLANLVNEAAGREDGSLFVVGDRKQAIYGWRGGDVRLFDELMQVHKGNLISEPMAESWRSCPAVLDLVNRVCGDLSLMEQLFGSAARRWTWDEHRSARPEVRGVARVEQVRDREHALERTVELLRSLGAGVVSRSFGVLVRTNDEVKEVADHLRLEGFDVVEEGRRLPASDQPLGIALQHLLTWLANPANLFARRVVEMSPLASVVTRGGQWCWERAWDEATRWVAQAGFADFLGHVVEELGVELSPHGQRRSRELIAAMEAFDFEGGTSPREAAKWLARLESAQVAGDAAIQVMTIHKSKGLGFDVVILPEVSRSQIPQMGRFEVAQQPGWLCSPPPAWVRAQVPELVEAEQRWIEDQRYEAMCLLYVALTRAKRGLYVMVPGAAKPSATREPVASFADWVRMAVQLPEQEGAVVVFGDEHWAGAIAPVQTESLGVMRPPLPRAVPKLGRITPSGTKKSSGASSSHSQAGMQFGTEFHHLMEQVGWLDEAEVSLPDSDVGRCVAEMLAVPQVAAWFERRGRRIQLKREQAILSLRGDHLLSGVIDRLHVHISDDGQVERVEVLDYKTDAVEEIDTLRVRYSEQMRAYRDALMLVYPGVPVACVLISSRHRAVLTLEA